MTDTLNTQLHRVLPGLKPESVPPPLVAEVYPLEAVIDDEIRSRNSLLSNMPSQTSQWYCYQMGETIGPMSTAELLEKARTGKIRQYTQICKGLDGKWEPAGKYKGLFDRNHAPAIKVLVSTSTPKPNAGGGLLEGYLTPTYTHGVNPSTERRITCPRCNSRQLTTQKKGFDGGGALAGGFLFGPIGLLTGCIGSGKVRVTCLNCGHNWIAGEVETPPADLSPGCAFVFIVIGVVLFLLCMGMCSGI